MEASVARSKLKEVCAARDVMYEEVALLMQAKAQAEAKLSDKETDLSLLATRLEQLKQAGEEHYAARVESDRQRLQSEQAAQHAFSALEEKIRLLELQVVATRKAGEDQCKIMVRMDGGRWIVDILWLL